MRIEDIFQTINLAEATELNDSQRNRARVQSLVQDVTEGHADQQRKIVKKAGRAVGEIGIDRESSPGVGQYYMKHYASGTDNSGYDSFEEALDDLKSIMKQNVYGELQGQGVAKSGNVFYNAGETANKKPVGKGTKVKNKITGIVGKAYSWSVVKGVPYLYVKGDDDRYQSPAKDWLVVDEQGVAEGKQTWQKHKNPRAGGMSKKAVRSYRRSNPGSKIQTAVTTKPSKLKKGSKASKRRLSFCRRMRGMKKKRTSAKTARDPNSAINKSLRRWNCESIQDMRELVMIAEQRIQQLREARGEDDTSYRAAQYILKHEGDLSGASEDDILEAAVRALVNMGINPRTVRAIMDNPDFLSDVIEHVRALKESLRDSEHHRVRVTLDDGSEKTVRIKTDEGFRELIQQYFAKRGRKVVDIDVDWGVRMDEKQDACYRKVKSRYKVWPSAYASGALVQCRKKGADNWGKGS